VNLREEIFSRPDLICQVSEGPGLAAGRWAMGIIGRGRDR
jgi:hypothetical protein